jgi:hypothetical protein
MVSANRRRRFAQGVLAFLCTPCVLFAGSEKTIDYIAACLRSAGGVNAYNRLETVAGRWRLSEGGPVVFYARRKTTGEWMFREETGEGRVILFSGAAEVVLDKGRPLVDPAVHGWVNDARERFFWLLGPSNLYALPEPPRDIGLGYVQDRLVRRLQYPASPSNGFSEGLEVYVDSGVFLLRGAGTPQGHWLFENEREVQNQIRMPTQWSYYSPKGALQRRVDIDALMLNTYVDVSLFDETLFSTTTKTGETP